MFRKSIATTCQFSAVAFLSFLFLFADGIGRALFGFIGSTVREIASIFYDPATQWMVVLCLTIYLIVFLCLDWRVQSQLLPLWFKNPNVWLVALVALVLLRYAFGYQAVAHTTQVLVLLAGIVFGKAFATWTWWQKNLVEQHTAWLVSLLISFFACATLWHPEIAREYQYHGATRWCGVWDNPNLYGLLMGTGVVLAAGQCIGVLRWKLEYKEWWRPLCIIFCSVVAIICGYGLCKSFSRGAWLGTACGLLYLIVKVGIWNQESEANNPARVSWHLFVWQFRTKRLSIFVILVSISLLGFWHFRFVELRPAQRAFSVANANDFSWRNRVAAWKGATHMMLDRPLTGFGWGQAESAYGKSYCPLDESAAIEMNDFFMLGISTGAPALGCLIAYLGLAYRRRSSDFIPASSIFTTCRSGSIVLLVGFWFDGGLFKLAVAPVFWTLFELSRLESGGVRHSVCAGVEQSKSDARSDAPCHLAIWLRRMAWFLGAVALLETAIYLGTPFFPVNNTTLTIARNCLIPPKESSDFDFLTTNPIWQGKELKILLEHVDLANYNRQIVNWKLDDQLYREYVLTPTIQPERDGQLNWRRPLWENFYPRIRHETDPETAAKIVLWQLHQRLPLSKKALLTIDEMWRQQTADSEGFETLCVAAFRSVGIPARLDSSQQAQFWTGEKWTTAPRP